MKLVIGFVALFVLGSVALGGPFGRFGVSGSCADGQCANGMCSAPVAFQAPIAKEAIITQKLAVITKAAEPCKCGVACPCGDQPIFDMNGTIYKVRATPAPVYAAPVYQEIPAASTGFSRPQRKGLLARLFHRRR